MCQTCGCGGHRASDSETVTVLENLLAENDRVASHVREHFNQHGVLAVNLMSSPGSGKTALLEATVKALPAGVRAAVVVGDLETENDADRIRRHGVPAVQITTGVTCHLDAVMVHDALHDLSLADIDILFIENVGNLVCPADFDLGHHKNVVLLSVTEGDDKPEKYPVMFRASDLVLVTKADLLPFIEEFDPERARRSIARVRGEGAVVDVSSKKGEGMAAWADWLVSQLADLRRQYPKDGKAHGHSHDHDEVAADHSHVHEHDHAHGHHHHHHEHGHSHA
ncbi:hydrogenase nickel incorporation protein HypB [Consotaella salsifontis]|uniref:Hydrogenase maturation factor HypB n=1 Tax=Consotaella salsifontis TaxID=1365950 RepID=A0A1T4LEU9_9HYPH|nr:hydrogenase nickel incorporation protein HypB [Consotaella salsifontis]SJZ53255.1 hydrogenase nickel incorporation protein HypB [Consotaella salsifontis]